MEVATTTGTAAVRTYASGDRPCVAGPEYRYESVRVPGQPRPPLLLGETNINGVILGPCDPWLLSRWPIRNDVQDAVHYAAKQNMMIVSWLEPSVAPILTCLPSWIPQ